MVSRTGSVFAVMMMMQLISATVTPTDRNPISESLSQVRQSSCDLHIYIYIYMMIQR